MLDENKLSIYQGMMQYLLDSTGYPLKKIANMANSPIQQLLQIHKHNCLPSNHKTELNLLKLFITVIDMELMGQWKAHRYLSKQ